MDAPTRLNTELHNYLRTTRTLAELCRQNGWIDDDTLRYELLDRDGRRVRLFVSFEEVIMEGSGCVAGRLACAGRLELELDEADRVLNGRIL